MGRRWDRLEKQPCPEDSNFNIVYLGVSYNKTDYLVNCYRFPKEWGWKSPKGTNYRLYKQFEYKAVSRKEWRVQKDKWIEGSLKKRFKKTKGFADAKKPNPKPKRYWGVEE